MSLHRILHASGRNTSESGSAVLAALAVLAVTLAFVAVALETARNGFRTTHQSSRWSQAAHAAEAGAEIGLVTAQKASWIADGWSGAPGAPGAAAVTKTITLSTGVPATGPITTTVAVDKIAMGSTQWLRIRATGKVNVFGGAVAGSDTRDTMLRKLSLRRDRQSGAALSAPQTTRTVEILAESAALRPFKYAFASKALFDIHALTVTDSYDSSDPTKSNFTPFTTYGVYDVAKRQSNGDVATVDPLNDWNLNNAHIWGDVLMPTTTKNAVGTANVHGSVTKGFTFNFPDEVSPGWTTVTQNHGAVTNVSKSFTGGTQASPTRHKFSSLNLSNDNRSVRVSNPAGQTESWVEIWVEGDLFIDGKSQTGIKLDPGVHATIYFGGKVEIKGGGGGYGLSNDSKLPSNLIVRAYGGSSGAVKDFIIAYTDFWGVVSAPWYKVKFDMNNRDVSGSFLAWQFDASDGTRLHYDEALAGLGHGAGAGWKVRSWVEAVR
jgi:hypothetical protein